MSKSRKVFVPTFPFDPKPVQQEMGQRIRAARAAAGITQTALAERIGVEASAVSQYESGDIDIPLSRLAHIAHALEVPMETLMFPNNTLKGREHNKDRDQELVEKAVKGTLIDIFKMAEGIGTGSLHGTTIWHIPQNRLEAWAKGESIEASEISREFIPQGELVASPKLSEDLVVQAKHIQDKK